MLTKENKAYLYEFVKNYISGVENMECTSHFTTGYRRGLVSLKEILEKIEAGYENDNLTSV